MADAAAHIAALHAVMQSGDPAMQATVRGMLAADLSRLVVRLSGLVCGDTVSTSPGRGLSL